MLEMTFITAYCILSISYMGLGYKWLAVGFDGVGTGGY